MGIRVCRVLGYGLADVGKGQFKKKGSKFRLNDTRFQEQSIIAGNNEQNYTIEGFLEFLESKPPEETILDIHWLRESLKSKTKSRLHDCFIHQAEYGLKNVFIVVPFVQLQEWFRHDDMIDYVQECYLGKGPVNRVNLIKEALYPWLSHIDKRDGRHLKSELSFAVRRILNSKEQIEPAVMNDMAKLLGFEDFDSLKENMKPSVPDTVIWQCQYGNVFVDPNTVYQLQPMLYTFWS